MGRSRRSTTPDCVVQFAAPTFGGWPIAKRKGCPARTTYSFQVVRPTVEVNALTLGSPIAGTIDTTGDIDEWEFEGLAGQLLSFDFLDVDIDAFFTPIIVNVVAPGGDVIAMTSGDGIITYFTDPDLAESGLMLLDEDGTYTLLIRGQTDSDILFSYEFMLTLD